MGNGAKEKKRKETAQCRICPSCSNVRGEHFTSQTDQTALLLECLWVFSLSGTEVSALLKKAEAAELMRC